MKKLIVNIFIFALVLLCTVGFSAWYIIYKVELKPEKTVGSISKYFDPIQEVVYNGQGQVPVHKQGIQLDFDSTTLSYSYKLQSEKNYTNGKPVNASIYDVLIKATDGRECKVVFTIKKKPIRVDQRTLELNYIAGQYRQWSTMEAKLKTMVKFVDSNDATIPVKLVDGDYTIDNIDNGFMQYSYTSLRTANIYGSTYNVNITVSNNYELVGNNFVVLKYKTCLIGNDYYTIEDALAANGDITLIGDASSPTSYVVTSFSKILRDNTYNLDGQRRILLPFDNGRTEDHVSLLNGPEATLENVYAALYIPQDITLNLNGSAKLAVGGVVRHQGIVKRRSVVMNDGIININDICSLLSYGFTKGNGMINVLAGAEVVDVFYLQDWPGGKASLNFKNDGVFPLLNWSVHNVSCATKVYKEGKYKAMTHINTAKMDFPIHDVFIIGDSNTANCLFKPNSGTKSDYIIKSAKIPSDSIDKDNQNVNYINEIVISGSYIDARMKISLKVPLLGDQGFETSTSIAVPISNFNIILENNTNLIFTNSSYILYKNSNILIKQGASLSIEGSAYVFVLQNSKITVCGQLGGSGTVSTKDQTGKLAAGNPIDTLNSGAIINLSNFNVATCKVRDGSNTTFLTINGTTEAFVNSPGTIAQLTNGNIYLSEGTNPYFFVVGTNVYTFYIDLNINGTIEEKIIYSFDPTMVFDVSKLSVPHLRYYIFESWCLDNTYQTQFNSHTFTQNNERLTLYAKFKPKIYDFTYSAKYNNAGVLEDIPENLISYTNLNATFTIEDLNKGPIIITTKANYQGKFFDGWYLGFDKTFGSKVPKINLEALNMYLNQVGDDVSSIPLYCEFLDSAEYTIKLEANHNTINITEFKTTSDTLKMDVYNSMLLPYNDDVKYTTYFVGWFTATDYINEFISEKTTLSSIDTDKDYMITLYAKWENKCKVTINQKGITNGLTEEYYVPSTSLDLSKYIIKDAYLLDPKIYDSNNQILTNSIVTITNDTTYNIEYMVNVNLSLYGNCSANVVGGSALNNGDNLVKLGSNLYLEVRYKWKNSGSIAYTIFGKQDKLVYSAFGKNSREVPITYTVPTTP